MSVESLGRIEAPALTLLGDLADQAVQAGGPDLFRAAFIQGALQALLCGVCVRLHLVLFPAGGPFLPSLSVNLYFTGLFLCKLYLCMLQPCTRWRCSEPRQLAENKHTPSWMLRDAAPGLWPGPARELEGTLLAPILVGAQRLYGRHLAEQRFASLLASAPDTYEGSRLKARLHSCACRPAFRVDVFGPPPTRSPRFRERSGSSRPVPRRRVFGPVRLVQPYQGVWPDPVAAPLLSLGRGGLRLPAVACLAVALADMFGCVWSLSRVGVSLVARVYLCLASALCLSAPMLLGVSLVPLCNTTFYRSFPPANLYFTGVGRCPFLSAGVLRPALRADVGRVLQAPWGPSPDAARGLGRPGCAGWRAWPLSGRLHLGGATGA
jgi:hypothetical protein